MLIARAGDTVCCLWKGQDGTPVPLGVLGMVWPCGHCWICPKSRSFKVPSFQQVCSGKVLGPVHQVCLGPDALLASLELGLCSPCWGTNPLQSSAPNMLLFHSFLLLDKGFGLTLPFPQQGGAAFRAPRLHLGQEMASPMHLPEQIPWRIFTSIPSSSRTEGFSSSKLHGSWPAEPREPLAPRQGPDLAAQQHLH